MFINKSKVTTITIIKDVPPKKKEIFKKKDKQSKIVITNVIYNEPITVNLSIIKERKNVVCGPGR